MGYCITQGETKFHIKKENHDAALTAIKGVVGDRSTEFYGDKEILAAKTLKEALEVDTWDVTIDDTSGDLTSLYNTCEKLIDQETYLTILAPFVTHGSFLEFTGEDGTCWRWVFKDGKMTEIAPTWNM